VDAIVNWITGQVPGAFALGVVLGFAFAVWFWYGEITRGRR